jgi:hypothetical protein
MSSAYAEAVTADQGRIWLLTVAFGPDGTPWAAFHCGNVTKGMTTGKAEPFPFQCPGNTIAPQTAPLALGVVGRLASGNGQGNANSQGNNNSQGNGNN